MEEQNKLFRELVDSTILPQKIEGDIILENFTEQFKPKLVPVKY